VSSRRGLDRLPHIGCDRLINEPCTAGQLSTK
jgi:hypothetical protein